MSEKITSLHPSDTYDAVVILGGGFQKNNNEYTATRFEDGDEFGMLGGFVRILAAEELYWQQRSQNFLFSTGVSAKQIAKFGPEVPSEAKVYSEIFLGHISVDSRSAASELQPPKIFLEDRSVNTATNLMEVHALCREHDWKRTAVVSSNYHIPRIEALYGLITQKEVDWGAHPVFIGAEDVLKRAQPGRYDEVIARAYASEAAQKRIKNEEHGLKNIQEGRYVLTEYQLAR